MNKIYAEKDNLCSIMGLFGDAEPVAEPYRLQKNTAVIVTKDIFKQFILDTDIPQTFFAIDIARTRRSINNNNNTWEAYFYKCLAIAQLKEVYYSNLHKKDYYNIYTDDEIKPEDLLSKKSELPTNQKLIAPLLSVLGSHKYTLDMEKPYPIASYWLDKAVAVVSAKQ